MIQRLRFTYSYFAEDPDYKSDVTVVTNIENDEMNVNRIIIGV